MNLTRLLVPMALLPVVASAQTTVYSTDFSSGSLRTSGTAYTAGDWTLASGKNSTSSTGSGSASLSASGLDFGMASTTSGFIETQNRFTSSPVTLANVNDSVRLTIVFTDKNNVLGGNSTVSANLAIGLYDSGGTNPAIGLQSSGLNGTAGSSFATGNAATWEGYLGQIRPSTGTNLLHARPIQAGAGTASANQDLLFNGVTGGFNNPGPASILSTTSTLALLATPAQYTASFTITKSATDSYTLDYTLSNASNQVLQTVTASTAPSSFITGLSIDSLAFGYRYTAPTGQGQVSGVTLTSVNVTHFSSVPEPSAFAALAGVAGLAFAAGRRRRSV